MAKSYCLYDLETNQYFFWNGTEYTWGYSRLTFNRESVNNFISSDERFEIAIETFIGFCQEKRYLKEYIKEYGDRLVFVQYVQSGLLYSNFDNYISLKDLYNGERL